MASADLTVQVELSEETKAIIQAFGGDLKAAEMRLREIVREEIEAHEQRQKVRRFARGEVK